MTLQHGRGKIHHLDAPAKCVPLDRGHNDEEEQERQYGTGKAIDSRKKKTRVEAKDLPLLWQVP